MPLEHGRTYQMVAEVPPEVPDAVATGMMGAEGWLVKRFARKAPPWSIVSDPAVKAVRQSRRAYVEAEWGGESGEREQPAVRAWDSELSPWDPPKKNGGGLSGLVTTLTSGTPGEKAVKLALVAKILGWW